MRWPSAAGLVLLAAWVVVAEAVLVLVDVALGAVAHAALIAVVVTYRGLRPDDEAARSTPVFALVSALRLLSLTIVSPALPEPVWLGLLGSIIAIAALRMGWLIGLRYRPRNLSAQQVLLQVVVAISGIALGYAAAELNPAQRAALWADAPLPLAVVPLVIAGISQEVLYRLVVQQALARILVAWIAVATASAISGAMYLGSGPVLFVAFMAVVGLAYGLVAHRTGAFAGIALSHSILLVTAAWLA